MKQPARDYHIPEGLHEFYKQALERSRKKTRLKEERNTQDEIIKTE